MQLELDRRAMLRLLAGASLVPLVGCGDDGGAAGGDAGSCAAIPEETAGPYPGDGSNGPNALTTSGVVRQDIRSTFGTLSGTADGVPMSIELTLVGGAGCAALAGYAVYVWHCDRAAQYSLYTLTTQNYLRGLQAADAGGKVTFTSIFPACYAGRWPHVHFEVYPSVAAAAAASNKVATSQLALPKDACDLVYATAGYEQSVTNLGQISLGTDSVFSDGATRQLATVTGSVAAGFTVALTVPVG